MVKYTNNHGISLPIAVWLLHDEYDHIDLPNYISATSLMAPTKQFILARRIPMEDREYDVSDFIASSLGTAIHDSIEKAWLKAGARIMKMLGYPDAICEKIAVNPDPEWLKLNPGYFPVYVEQRGYREITVGNITYTIGGKFDLVIDGRLFDNKSTSVYSWLLGSKDEQYSQQGSIYKWIHEDKIIDDYIYIQFIFTDWKKVDAIAKPDTYPQLRVMEHPVPLMDMDSTEAFIRSKLELLTRYKDKAEEDIPDCTDEELWRSEPQFKYYSDPTKTNGRSTKNFDNLADANRFMAEKGGKGIVITKPGTVKRCAYCPAESICQQRKRYETDV
jgi:hypothetical protein